MVMNYEFDINYIRKKCRKSYTGCLLVELCNFIGLFPVKKLAKDFQST